MERVDPADPANPLLVREHVERYRFASQFVRGREVLDVACGMGYGAPILRGAGATKYCGIDIDPDTVSNARTTYGSDAHVTYYCADACTLSAIAPESQDLVVSFETIEHLGAPQQFLEAVQRVLRSDGVLIISTPNRVCFSPGNTLESKPSNPFHVREWNRGEFTTLLKRFFLVKQVFGQRLYPVWKAELLHQAARHVLINTAVSAAKGVRAHLRGRKSTRPGTQGNGAAIPVDIRPLSPWQSCLYMVFVCSQHHARATT